MLLLALYFVQRFILQTNLRKKKKTPKWTKKHSQPPYHQGIFVNGTTYQQLRFICSPCIFHLPLTYLLVGKQVIARLPGDRPVHLRSIPAPRCRPENVQRHPVQRLPTFLNGNPRRRKESTGGILGFFVKFFWGKFFGGDL